VAKPMNARTRGDGVGDWPKSISMNGKRNLSFSLHVARADCPTHSLPSVLWGLHARVGGNRRGKQT